MTLAADEVDVFEFVILVHDFAPRDEIVGGTEIRPYEFARWLRTSGGTCEVWLTQPGDRRSDQVDSVTVRTIPGARRRRLRHVTNLPVLIVLLFLAHRKARRRGRQLVVHQRVPGVITLAAGFLPWPIEPSSLLMVAMRYLGITTWASIHDLSPEHDEMAMARLSQHAPFTARQRAGWKFGNIARLRAQRIGTTYATFVTVVSEPMRSALIERHKPRKAMVAITRAGVDPVATGRIPAWEPPRGRPWTLGYAGSPFDVDLDFVVEATQRLSGDHRLILAGREIPSHFRSDAVQVIDDHRYADFPRLAADVDIWLAPVTDHYMRHLTWPLKTVMYAASGRPLVTMPSDELETTGFSRFVYTADPDPDAFAAAVEVIMTEPQRARERACAAREHALSSHRWDQQFVGALRVLTNSLNSTASAQSRWQSR